MIAISCPGREQMLAYAAGKLSEEVSQAIDDHIDACPACQAQLTTLGDGEDTLVAAIRRAPRKEEFEDEPQCRQAAERGKALAPPGNQPGKATHVQQTGPAAPTRLGEYELLEELGEGGMGAVYRARQVNLDRVVAIKVLLRGHTEDERAVARFYREMKAVGRVDHPNIVRAVDAREIEGKPVLVMEYVAGLSLHAVVKRVGPLSVADACEVVRQAALGLQCVHASGLVHRDIKPSNLMVTPQGQVKILDLGLALLQVEHPSGEMTAAGQTMGTADYIAPEQVTDSHNVDIRADIYSVGCTLYKLLSGRPPFSGPEYKGNFDKMLAHVQTPIKPLRLLRPEVPEELAVIVHRMLAKNPGERFATPAEVAEAMVTFTATCDLAGLMAKATGCAKAPATPDAARGSTIEVVSSASVGTAPSAPIALAENVDAQVAAPLGEKARKASAFWGRAVRELGVLWQVKWARMTAAMLLAGMAGGVLLGIIIRIQSKDGPEVVIHADNNASVAVEKDGASVTVFPVPSQEKASPAQTPPASVTTGKPPAPPKPASIQLTPEPVELPAGEPVSKMALVAQPAPIPGVRSWTIETIGHRGSNAIVAYSPDGRYLATSCSDETIRLWDAQSHKFLRAIVAHDASISGICWSPDGKILASASVDRTVRLWDPESGRRLLTLPGEEGFRSIAWSPDGRLLAASMPRRLQLWEFSAAPRPGAGSTSPRREGWRRVASGLITRVIDLDRFVTLLWSPDGKMLFGGRGSGAFVYDVQAANLRSLDARSLYMGDGGMALSPDGRTVAINGKPITLWKSDTGELVRECPAGVDTDVSVAWSPDGKRLAGGGKFYPSTRRPLLVWDAETGKVFRDLNEAWPISSLAYSRSGELLTAGTVCGRVDAWEADSGVKLEGLPAHQGWRDIVCWSADAKTLACAGRNHLPVQAMESGSGRIVRESIRITHDLLGPVAWSSDPDVLTYANGNDAVVWRLTSGEEWAIAAPGRANPVAASWSRGAQTVAIGDDRGEAEILELTKPEPKRTLVGAKVKALAYSPDGESLAVAEGREAKLCDPKTGKVRETVGAAGAPIANLCWSPDSKLIAVTCEDKNVYVFEVAAKRVAATCKGHEEAAFSLGWSEDGKTLISGSPSEVCVWDAASGRLLRTIADDGGAISRDGRLIASRGQSSLRIRRTEDGKLLRTIVSLRDRQHAAISPDGHFRGSPDVEKEFVYVMLTDSGEQVTLTPEEFAKKYAWKNDPSRVQLGTEVATATKPQLPAEAVKPASQPTPQSAPKPTRPVAIQITPEPLDFPAGAPLSKMALVAQPAAIPGVRSWTIETIGHRDCQPEVAYSSDGRFLATSCGDGTIRLWDAAAGKLVRAIVAHDRPISRICWSPDSRILASAGRDGTIRLWDPDSGRRLLTLRGARGLLTVAWSPDGRLLAGNMAGGGICLWDFSPANTADSPSGFIHREGSQPVARGVTTRMVDAPEAILLRWSADGKTLVCGAAWERVYRCDVESGKWQWFGCCGPYVALSPDGKNVAFPGMPASVWDMATGQIVRKVAKSSYASTCVAWAPNGRTLAGNDIADSEKAIAVWDASTGKLLRWGSTASDERVSSLAYSSSSTALAGGTSFGRVCVWEAETGRILHVLPGHRGSLTRIAWSFDGKALAHSTWHHVPGQSGATYKRPLQVTESGSGRLLHESSTAGFVNTLAWSPNTGNLACGWLPGFGQGAWIWRLEAGEQIQVGGDSGATFRDFAWSPDAKFLAVATEKGEGQIWAAESEKPTLVCSLPVKQVKGLAFAPDGKTLAVGSGRDVKLCDTKTGHVRESLPPAGALVAAVSWSPDARTLAASCEDKKVYVFDLATKSIAVTCEGHQAVALSLAWSEGGKTLVSGSPSEVCAWDAGSGKLLRTIVDDGGAISADGRLVASRGPSTIRIRRTDSGQLLRTIVTLRDRQYAAISPDGHFGGSSDVEREFVYVVLTDSGEQVTLTPEEFAKKYAWKNDPSKVQSTTGTKADDGTKKPEKQTDSPKSQQAGPAKQTHESGKRGRNKP